MQFHHFAYMAIGVAMLGFGAAGTWLALARRRTPETDERWFRAAALLAAGTLVASPALALRVPLDATRLAWDAGEWPRLFAVYLVLAVPFALGAAASLLALALEPGRTGALYGAGFVGAGAGALAALAVLGVVPPARAIALPAILAAGGALAAQRWRGPRRPAAAVAVGVAAVAAGAAIWPPWRLAITPFKGLPQIEAYPDARHVAQRTSPVGWVVAATAPAWRHAPGLSLAYRGAFPAQTGLFLDGDLAGAATDWRAQPAARELLAWLPTAIPFALGVRRRVLVIGAGGGTDVWTAAAHGARDVTAVELSADLIGLAAELGGEPADTRVRWVAGDARSWVARAPDRFDLITIGPGGAFATAAAGVHGMSEDFLHTREAYAAYLGRLEAGGVLAITRWLAIPPREAVRVVLTADAALRRVGAPAPEAAIAVIRSWATATVLVTPAGFTPTDVVALRRWAATRQFDVDWPGGAAPAAGFHALDEPALFRAAAAAAAGPDSAARFAAAYPFDVAPRDDARPYPHHFLRGRSLGRLLGGDRGAWLPFAEWGYVSLVATLVQSVLAATVLLVLPVALRRGAPPNAAPRIVGYFSALGLAYLVVEVAVIQQLGLLLGHPVYAVAAVLGALLIGSGVGSAWSDRLPAHAARAATAVLCAMVVLYAGALLPVAHGAQAAPAWFRVVLAAVLVAPLALAMGMPFPLGVRSLVAGERTGLAWAWAANGFASVVAAPLAALIGLELGSPVLLATGALAYAAAAGLARGDGASFHPASAFLRHGGHGTVP